MRHFGYGMGTVLQSRYGNVFWYSSFRLAQVRTTRWTRASARCRRHARRRRGNPSPAWRAPTSTARVRNPRGCSRAAAAAKKKTNQGPPRPAPRLPRSCRAPAPPVMCVTCVRARAAGVDAACGNFTDADSSHEGWGVHFYCGIGWRVPPLLSPSPGLAWPGLAWPGLAWPGLASCLAWPIRFPLAEIDVPRWWRVCVRAATVWRCPHPPRPSRPLRQAGLVVPALAHHGVL